MPAEAAGDPLDEFDRTVLDEVAAAYALIDPPPADLDQRVGFAIALDRDLDLEVARLTEDQLAGSGARAGTGADQARTLTFDCAALTVLVTVVALPGDRRRLDGWLAPAAALTVELRAGGSAEITHAVTADETGRFVVDDVPPGLAQLTVHLPQPGRTVVTPAVVL